MVFSETTKAQLGVDGTIIGTFEEGALGPDMEPHESSVSISILQAGLSPGNIVRCAVWAVIFSYVRVSDVWCRQPRWGIRMECVKLPDAKNNM